VVAHGNFIEKTSLWRIMRGNGYSLERKFNPFKGVSAILKPPQKHNVFQAHKLNA
jgi:hypothetical protein